jgi:acetyl esterase/lipase
LSLASQAVRLLLRITAKRPAQAALASPRFLQVVRRSFNRGALAFSRPSRGVTVERIAAPGVDGEWLIPTNADPSSTIVYIHGGGFIACDAAGYRTLTSSLARATGMRVAALNYPLAPEHPYPAALESLVAAYAALRSAYPAIEHVLVAGDSAGGNLALATALALRDHDGAPDGLVLFSPWLDLHGQSRSMRENRASDDVVVFDPDHRLARAYAAGRALDDPAVSPLFANLRGLPRTYITASTIEMLRDDAISFEERARASGVDVRLRLVDGVPHVWPLFRFLPESRSSLAEVRTFAHGS